MLASNRFQIRVQPYNISNNPKWTQYEHYFGLGWAPRVQIWVELGRVGLQVPHSGWVGSGYLGLFFKLMITSKSGQSNFIERTVPSVHYRLLALLPKREWKMGSILRAHSAFGLSQFHDELWQHLEHASTTWTVNSDVTLTLHGGRWRWILNHL